MFKICKQLGVAPPTPAALAIYSKSGNHLGKILDVTLLCSNQYVNKGRKLVTKRLRSMYMKQNPAGCDRYWVFQLT